MGVILYQMLTGRLPFDGGGPVEIALRQIREEPIAPSVVNPDADPALEAVCLRALRKNRSDRWANAREMRAALRGITASDSIRPATPTTTLGEDVALELPARPHKARRRWMTPVAGAIAIMAALVAGRSVSVHRSALATTPATPDVAPALVLARLPAVPTVEPAPELPAAPPTTTTIEPIAPPVRPPPPPSPQRSVRTAVPRAAPVETHVDTPASEPEPVPAPPVATQEAAPAPPPAPAPSPPAVAAVVTQPPLANAHVEIGGATQAVGATTLGFQRALAPATTRATACYRDALARLPAPAEGNGMLHVETNDIGVIKQARTTGALSNEVGDCIAKAVIGAKVPNVDTGNASADVPLAYRLR